MNGRPLGFWRQLSPQQIILCWPIYQVSKKGRGPDGCASGPAAWTKSQRILDMVLPSLSAMLLSALLSLNLQDALSRWWHPSQHCVWLRNSFHSKESTVVGSCLCNYVVWPHTSSPRSSWPNWKVEQLTEDSVKERFRRQIWKDGVLSYKIRYTLWIRDCYIL